MPNEHAKGCRPPGHNGGTSTTSAGRQPAEAPMQCTEGAGGAKEGSAGLPPHRGPFIVVTGGALAVPPCLLPVLMDGVPYPQPLTGQEPEYVPWGVPRVGPIAHSPTRWPTAPSVSHLIAAA